VPSAPRSWPPLGYRVVVAEVLRKKEKKVLEEDPVEAALVNRIYRLYVTGEPGSGHGRIGIKAVATYLNTNIRWRGRLFTTSFVEDVLKNEAYVGTHHYNRKDSRTGLAKVAGSDT
jgi:site-specific DNA recombinase